MAMNQSEEGNKLSEMDFTVHARQSIEKTTQDPYFRDRDPEMIYEALTDEIRSVAFGDYLKRYIRRKQINGQDSDDLDVLCDAFKKTNVPPSFTPTTAKLRSLAKNWLTQRAVSRNVVLLLGFALEMTPDEVNSFLTKALREPRINPKDPFEVICWYCYQYRLPYAKQEELWGRIVSGELSHAEESEFVLDSTVRVRRNMESIGTEDQLIDYLGRLDLVHRAGRQSVSARKQFDELYRKACGLVAKMKTEMDEDDAGKSADRLAELVSHSDRYYDYQKNERIRKERDSFHRYSAEDIMPVDLENVLYSAVPKDRNGNLTPMKESSLNDPFVGKRMTRQRIMDIQEGKTPINRFELITLCFFLATGETDRFESPGERYEYFINEANRVLRESDMEPLYVANPYESFLLMCMLADDPLGSFSDVWELSY
ncbi:MAG: hypothetical protein IKQ45_03740 [Clostridia bacterium]|nr:hypothetical protein [Clostridia bacterium]